MNKRVNIVSVSFLVFLFLYSCNNGKTGIEGNHNNNNNIVITDKDVTVVAEKKNRPINTTEDVINKFIEWYKKEYLEWLSYETAIDGDEVAARHCDDKYDIMTPNFEEVMKRAFNDGYVWIFPAQDTPSKDNLLFKINKIEEDSDSGNARYDIYSYWNEPYTNDGTGGLTFRLILVNNKWKIDKISTID